MAGAGLVVIFLHNYCGKYADYQKFLNHSKKQCAMNENNNRVQAALPDKTLDQCLGMIAQLNGLLESYMTGLSPEERIALPKINVDNRDFINDAINQMQTADAKNLLPAFLKPADAESDLRMFAQMEKLAVALTALLAKIDATRILAGSEAYTTALTFKKIAEAGEMAGITGAGKIAETLRTRFKPNGGRAGSEDATGNPA